MHTLIHLKWLKVRTLRKLMVRQIRLRGRLFANWSAVLLVGLMSGWVPEALAAAPTNDVCAGAIRIPEWAGMERPYLTPATDIREATLEDDPETECQSSVTNGIWFTFTPTNTTFFTLSTAPQVAPGTTVEDTVLAIYTSIGGCEGPFEQVPNSTDTQGCNDDIAFDELHSAITTLLFADATYYILAWKYDDEIPATPGRAGIQLQVVRTTPPNNDTCDQAQTVELNLPVLGTTIGATNDYQLSESPCFTGFGNLEPSLAELRDVVYAFAAPSAGFYSFKVVNSSLANDFTLYLLTNCPAGAPPVVITNCLAAANRNVGGAEEIPCVFLADQQLVYAVVDENLYEADPNYQGGNFRFEVTECVWEVEPNDYPTNANPFVCGIEGASDPRWDVDFFALGTYPAGSRLFAMVNGNAANRRRDFDLRVTTRTDTLEYDDEDNSLDFGNFAPNICGVALPREPVFLSVDYQNSAESSEPYRVYAVVQPPWTEASPETEPNDTLTEANFSPQNYFRGSLDGAEVSTDVDTFTFEAESGELLLIGLDANPLRDDTPIDARVELLDEEGNILVSANNIQDEEDSISSTNTSPGSLAAFVPFSPGEALVYRIIDDGVYFAQVSISPNSATNLASGDYLLSISRQCQSTVEPAPLEIVSVTQPGPDHFHLVLRGQPFVSYAIQVSSNLTTWAALSPATYTADASGLVEVDDTTSPAEARRFYRGVRP